MIDAQGVIGEIKRLRAHGHSMITLEILRSSLVCKYGIPTSVASHAIVEALLAGKIELHPARFVTGVDTNTYMVFVRE